MKTAFYQLEGGGNWILSPDISGQVRGSYYLKDMRFASGAWNLGIIDPKDGSYLIIPKVITEYTKEDGASYRSPEEIERICGKFFGTTSYIIDSGAVTGSEIVLTNETTGVKTRFIATETGYRIDVTLTELGFDGIESIDGGITGDWVTTTSA